MVILLRVRQIKQSVLSIMCPDSILNVGHTGILSFTSDILGKAGLDVNALQSTTLHAICVIQFNHCTLHCV